MPRPLVLFITLLLAGAATAGGMLAMTQLQRSVQVVPGDAGCARLAGDRKVECFAQLWKADMERVAGTDLVAADADVLARALDVVDDAAAEDAVAAGACHQAMHDVARGIGSRAADRSTPLVFPARHERLCAAGFAHGLVEGYVSEPARLESLAQVFAGTCSLKASRNACGHGLGHAVVRDAGDAATGGRLCATLPKPNVADCLNGVYMEVAMRDDVSADAYAGLCRSVDDDAVASSSCWYYLGALGERQQLPVQETVALCRQAGPHRADCVEAVGRNLGVERLAECADLSPGVQPACFRGAIALELGSRITGEDTFRAACQTLVLPSQSACTDELQRLVFAGVGADADRPGGSS